MSPLPVWQLDDPHSPDAERAAALGLACVSAVPADGFYLYRDESGALGLRAAHDRRTHPLYCDLADAAARRLGSGARRSPLARACGLQRPGTPRIVDVTAGLGRDTATLAGLGATVQPIERHPALFALLADGWTRACAGDERVSSARSSTAGSIAAPILADARAWLAAPDVPARYDIIYLDPMFASTRRKAKPQKAMAWLGEIAGADADAFELLEAARQAGAPRVVVKQHGRAAPLTTPSHQIHARAVRFDVYLQPAQ